MRPHRLAALLALTLPSTLAAQPRPAPAPAAMYYDPAPWMGAVRPALRGDLARLTGLERLDRLPRYDLSLSLADNGRDFTVREELWFTNNERAPVRDLVLRLYGNTVARRETRPDGTTTTTVARTPLHFGRGQCVEATCTVAADSTTLITVRPSAPVAPGGHLRVSIELTGTLPEIAAGRTNLMTQGMESFASLSSGESGGDYGVLATGDGIVSLANFYAVLAPRVGGRWERGEGNGIGDIGSDDLANVHAMIEVPGGFTVATTGLTLRVVDGVSGGTPRRRVEVGAVAVRDFAAMAGRTLQVATRRVGDVDVRSLFLPAHRAAGERVLDVAAHALEVYEQRFGTYPYADLDVVEAPLVGGAGGVEFPGLVTVASMFYRGTGDGAAPAAQAGGGGLMDLLNLGNADAMMSRLMPSMLEFVTAHEVAHQYWHGLVGSDSRQHPFIDESLAQWSAAYYLEARYGAERARRDADMQVKMNYQFMRMLGEADAPVDRPAGSFHSPMSYAGLVYGKGPYLYNALRAAAGDAVFFRGVRRYVDTWRFRTAPADGFVNALAAESPLHAAQFRAMAHRWLHESHGDDDLGQADMSGMLGAIMGDEHGQLSPEMQQALQTLGPMLQGGGLGRLLGGAGGGSAGQGGAPGQGGAQPSQQEVEQMLQQAIEGLGATP